jgi:hypothetical protein
MIVAGLALTALAAVPLAAQYDPELQYQDRGDRHEGLRPKPIAGYDVALLSARVDYREESRGWPEKLRLRFYLPEPQEVFVTVRQLRPKTTYYWLDQVKPASPWEAGKLNGYAWPTATVLRKLTSVSADNLGAVVRLGRELPGKKERVVPAVFYHSHAPAAIEGYRFTFKTNGTACVTARIYRGETEVFLRRRPPQTRDHCGRDETGIRERAGSPFFVRWPSAGQPEGWYRLVLSGYFEADNEPLDQEVAFYHKADLGAGG